MKPLRSVLPETKTSINEKILLIKGIEYWQHQRWVRLKRWHAMDIPFSTKHMFMQREVDLIRDQKNRLQILKDSINASDR